MEVIIPKHYDESALQDIIKKKAFPYIGIDDLKRAHEEDGASFEELEITEVRL